MCIFIFYIKKNPDLHSDIFNCSLCLCFQRKISYLTASDFSKHASRSQRDKLMINDVTSMWQTGNHGDATLNKHAVPTSTQRGKKKKKKRGNRERVETGTQMRWGKMLRRTTEEEEGRTIFHPGGFIASFFSRTTWGWHTNQSFKGSARSKITDHHYVRKKDDITIFTFVPGTVL